MNGIGIILTTSYVMAAVAAWLLVFAWLYHTFKKQWPTLTWGNGDRLFALVWGGVVAAAWPVSGLVFAAAWTLKRIAGWGVFEASFRRLEKRLDHTPRAEQGGES